MASEASKDCSVCCDKYNKSNRTKIVCNYGDCNYEVCKTCVQTYLVGTAVEPHCMNCKKPWTKKFLQDNLNKTYLSKEYKEHHKKLLLDREISKLPETMHLVERYNRLHQEEGRVAALREAYENAKILVDRTKRDLDRCYYNIRRLKMGRGLELIANDNADGAGPAEPEEEKEEKKKFIMPCPANDCRGFLSTQYKCEACKLFTCSKCHDVIGENKELPHDCKKENIESAELIKKETKGCPKCGTRIFKISGCDQMWCPTCQVAFSWNTGKIDNGIIHNPHFYEYRRQNANGQAIARNPGDIPCGGLISYNHLTMVIGKINIDSLKDIVNSHPYFIKNREFYGLKPLEQSEAGVTGSTGAYTFCPINKEFQYNIYYTDGVLNTTYINQMLRGELSSLHTMISHINVVEVPTYRTNINTIVNFEQDRCKYILKQITKEQLGTIVIKNTTAQQKMRELLHLFELLSNIGNDIFNDLYQTTRQAMNQREYMINALNRLLELQELITYCNNQFREISNTYSQVVPYIKVSHSRTYTNYNYNNNYICTITYVVEKKKFEKPESAIKKSNGKAKATTEPKEKKPRKPRTAKGKEKAPSASASEAGASASEAGADEASEVASAIETITIEDSDDYIEEEFDIPDENIVVE